MTALARLATRSFRSQPEFWTLLDNVAQAKGSNASEYARQAIAEALERDGADLAKATRAKTAGELYDSRIEQGQPQRRYALIVGDHIDGCSYHADKPEDQPGRRWLPVFHEDSQPFDAARHWRLTPEFQLDGDRVVALYPVVAKSLELA